MQIWTCASLARGSYRMATQYRYQVLVMLLLGCTVLVQYSYDVRYLLSLRLEKEYEGDTLNDTLRASQLTLAPNTTSPLLSAPGEEVLTPSGPMFQRINQNDAWVYSAFFDTYKDKNLIRVFGMQPHALQNSVFCHLGFKHENYTMEGKRTLLQDNHGYRLRVVSYECDLIDDRRPDLVSITWNTNDSPTNSLRVLYPSSLKRNFTVCYAILYNFTNYKQIIQSVEFDRILGAEHFFVYNMSISNTTDALLRHYQRRGLLTVMQWPLPISEIHYQGQVLAINDCVYRNKGVSKYVAIHDTDEIIIPNNHDNWGDLIDQVNKDYDQQKQSPQSHEKLGTYIVESTFFQDRPNASVWSAIKQNYSISDQVERLFENYSLTVFTDLVRLQNAFVGGRQKSIVRPEMVLFPDVHTTITHRPSATDVTVRQSLALVHHQRKYSSSSPTDIVEATSLRFKDKMLPLVNETYSMFFT
nr:glycosyltransferase family 92 protein F13G3.3 [Biomphalaria glabrata]